MTYICDNRWLLVYEKGRNMLDDKMGIYVPSYYGDFHCIADKCKHSCCIDWEICIDSVTYEKYKKIDSIINTVSECDGGICFSMNDSGRCPHLNDTGLCNIIISYGEEYLSDICRNHPRFFNYISSNRTEAGIGIVCEEACRLILENEKPMFISKIADICGENESNMEKLCFDALPQRDHIIFVIESDIGSYEHMVSELKHEFDIPDLYTFDGWIARFLDLEILDTDWKDTLSSMRGKTVCDKKKCFDVYAKYYRRLLAYFVYRHVSVAESPDSLRARLGFAILSVEMIRRLFEDSLTISFDTLIDFARRYSVEIEYSEDNTAELIFEFESAL